MQKIDNNSEIILFLIYEMYSFANVTEIIGLPNGELLRKKYYFCG